jgi:hypothetical protein
MRFDFFCARAARVMAIVIALPLAFTGATAIAPAQDLAKPESPKYVVAGFRDARFGMTEPEVRAVVVKSFGLKDADVTTSTNPAEGTTLLTARMHSLEPGPGEAQVSYIFGFKSKRLIQVNIIWGQGAKPPIDGDVMSATGARLVRYFQGFSWKKDATRIGVPVGDNTVMLFVGEDEKKGAVRVVVDGVKYQMMREGTSTSSPEPKGPATLVVNYIADRDTPDITTIERGKF